MYLPTSHSLSFNYPFVAGGNVVLLYASKYGDVSTVVNVSGRFDLNIGQLERFGEAGMKTLEQEGFLDVKDKAGKATVWVTRVSSYITACFRVFS